MKIARFFAVILGLMGTALMAFSIGLCLVSLDQEVELKEVPAGAAECAQNLMEAIDAGDFTAASQLMYGQPQLGADREPAQQAGKMIWDAFIGSFSYEWKGDCYATDSGIARDVVITAMEIPGVTDSLSQRAHALLTAEVAAATDMAELYDEENNFREDLVADVLSEAVVQALAEDAKTVTRELTLHMISRDGQWWVVPDQALLDVFAGGLE